MHSVGMSHPTSWDHQELLLPLRYQTPGETPGMDSPEKADKETTSCRKDCASTSLIKLQVPIDLYLLQHVTIYLAFHNS